MGMCVISIIAGLILNVVALVFFWLKQQRLNKYPLTD
jgi:hypothetical protein